MEKSLFQEHRISDLARSIRQKLGQLRVADLNSAASIKTRQDALRVLAAYEPKSRDGKPLPPAVNAAEQNSLVEIELTGEEAKKLGVTGRRIALQELLGLVSTETTSRQPADITRQSYAAYLLDHGTKKYERYDAAVTDGNAKYIEACRAFGILSKPENYISEASSKLITQGEAILGALVYNQPSHAGEPIILLADVEYVALNTGKFNEIDSSFFAPAEQRMRGGVNKCIENMYQDRTGTHKIPFRALFDPRRIADIEILMRNDTTANWLLNNIKNRNLPVILCEYTMPDHLLPMHQLTMAAYVMRHVADGTAHREISSSTVSKVIDYIELFTNLSNNHDIASAFSHEGRHFWQYQIVPEQERLHDSPIDKIVWGLLSEADAHAIEEKVTWGIHRKTGKSGLHTNGWHRFENDFSNPSHKNASMATKVKKATQAGFIGFLEREFSNPAYLDKFISESLSGGHNLNSWCRSLPESRLLTDRFLTRISQVGDTAHYLDQQGIERTKRLFLEKLPPAIADYREMPKGPHNKLG